MMVSRLLVGVILGLTTASSTPAAAQAILTFADQPSLGAIPDSPSGICQTPGPPRDVTFNFTGVPGVVHGVEIGAQLTHPWVGDVLAQLIAPNGTSHDIFGYTGAAVAATSGDGSNLLGTYIFSDSAPLQWWGTAASFDNVTAMPSGAYRTSFRGGAGGTGAASQLSAAFDGLPAAGIWKLRLTDGCHNDTGAVGNGTYLQLDTTEPILDPLPPFGLAVSSIVGNLVTLSWDYNSVDGPQPTGFILEGGIAPGQLLASIPTGDTNIFFTFVAPTGAFYVRVPAIRRSGHGSVERDPPVRRHAGGAIRAEESAGPCQRNDRRPGMAQHVRRRSNPIDDPRSVGVAVGIDSTSSDRHVCVCRRPRRQLHVRRAIGEPGGHERCFEPGDVDLPGRMLGRSRRTVTGVGIQRRTGALPRLGASRERPGAVGIRVERHRCRDRDAPAHPAEHQRNRPTRDLHVHDRGDQCVWRECDALRENPDDPLERVAE